MTALVTHWHCDAPCGIDSAYTDGRTTWCPLTREQCRPKTCERAIEAETKEGAVAEQPQPEPQEGRGGSSRRVGGA